MSNFSPAVSQAQARIPDYVPTLAEKLSDEADQQREHGTPYNDLVAQILDVAARTAIEHGLTDEVMFQDHLTARRFC